MQGSKKVEKILIDFTRGMERDQRKHIFKKIAPKEWEDHQADELQ